MEKVILVGISKKSKTEDSGSSLDELQRLTETAGGQVAEVLAQKLDRFHPATLIGQGKVEELSQAVRLHRVRTVIFDQDLAPAQQKNLEAFVGAKIVDRTRLILDIFAKRARTKEGELQVELAQLSYMLPRLTGSWRSYSQQVGGIGTRGPGERQLEYERRHIQLRIKHLKRAIEHIKDEREVQRRRRLCVPVPQAAIIGYTNVGKSTLLNALTKTQAVYADDKLFATLDPTTRRVRLPEGGWAVFTDTVGFIQKLPTALVAAFRSTLEEATLADCLIHVTDASSEDRRLQARAVESVLKELKAAHIPRIEALNKADRLTEAERRKILEEAPQTLFISAKQGQGLQELLERIQEVLHERWVLRELDLPSDCGSLLANIHGLAQVLDRTCQDGRIRVRLRITQENWSRLQARVHDKDSRTKSSARS